MASTLFKHCVRSVITGKACATGQFAWFSTGRLNKLIRPTNDEIKRSGLWKEERIITSAQHSSVTLQSAKRAEAEKRDEKEELRRGRPFINFCANNYLGLSSHPSVIKRSKQALDSHGAGLSSVRFICGTQDIHKDLETRIAEFHSKDDAILYTSCFDANAGLFEVLLGPQDAVISDQLNHASLVDGIRLCKADKWVYKNGDVTDLERCLKEARNSNAERDRKVLIVTDGVFSMDGNLAPLREISGLAHQYDAILLIDECHATGFLGETGRGTEQQLGITSSPDVIINSTLGKAVGGACGGYTAGPRELVQLLRQKSRPYLFSNSLPPAVVGSAAAAFDVICSEEGVALRNRLADNTRLFRELMTQHGMKVAGHSEHPICPLMLYDAKLAAQLAGELLDKWNIFVVAFSYPVVPRDKARIRIQMSAAHTTAHVEQLVHAILDVSAATPALKHR